MKERELREARSSSRKAAPRLSTIYGAAGRDAKLTGAALQK
jgi:hypothetical protein